MRVFDGVATVGENAEAIGEDPAMRQRVARSGFGPSWLDDSSTAADMIVHAAYP